MKILFYNHTAQIGGAERVLLSIVENRARLRFEPVVICPTGPLHEQLRKRGITTTTANVLNARFTFRPDQLLRYFTSFARVIFQLRRQVNQLKPDLIHANSVRAGLVATFATVGSQKRVIWHVHDLLPLRHPFNPFIRAIAFVSRRTRIVAVAQASADRFTRSLLPLKNRVTVIRNGIDVEGFRPRVTARRALRDELHLSEDQPVIGIIGRLTPSKGQLEVLRAFAELLAKFPDAILLLAGAPAFNREHEYADLLKRTAHELGIYERVRFLGERNDVATIMQALDLLIVNSSSEACSLVLLEAMATGTAVIATAVGGTPEIIDHGETGWLVSLHDRQSLADALRTLLQDPKLRSRVGQNARRTAVARLSSERFVRDVGRLYMHFQPVTTTKSLPHLLDEKLATD
jgi:glycosyltransferase involved in cell wall biosynthesis